MRHTYLLSALFLMGSIVEASSITHYTPPPACSSCPKGWATAGSSAFDSNSEGWRAVTADESTNTVPTALTDLAVNYHLSGGYISIFDPDSNSTFFQAPSAYLAGLGTAMFGTLSFDIKTDQKPDYNGALVVIKGGGMTLVYTPATQQTGTQWSTVDVSLAPGGDWHVGQPGGSQATLADFQTVFHSASALWIGAETTSGLVETVSLDNVSLCAPASVPEPSTWALAGAGLLLLFKRRK